MSENKCPCGASLPSLGAIAYTALVCSCGRRYECTVSTTELVSRVDALERRVRKLEPQGDVVTYRAAEAIQPGTLCVLRPDGSVVAAQPPQQCPGCGYHFTLADLSRVPGPYVCGGPCLDRGHFTAHVGDNRFEACLKCAIGAPEDQCEVCRARRRMFNALGPGAWCSRMYKGPICMDPTRHLVLEHPTAVTGPRYDLRRLGRCYCAKQHYHDGGA